MILLQKAPFFSARLAHPKALMSNSRGANNNVHPPERNPMKKLFRRNRNRKGFTLIELLIVILVLAILMAVALPLYLSAVSDSQLKTCRSNMQTIANAEQAYKTSNRAHVYTTTLTDLKPNLGSTPICPSAGAYSVTISTGASTANNGATVPAGGIVIACSATGHGVFAPGIDSE